MSTDLPIPPKSAELTNGSEAATNANLQTRQMSAMEFGAAIDQGGGSTPNRAISRYLSTLKRYKWLVLLIVVLGTAGGYLSSTLVESQYSAQSRIWFDGASGPRGPIDDGKLFNTSSWVDLLNSYAVLDFVVQKERLYLETDPTNEAAFANFKVKDRFLPGDYRVVLAENNRTLVLESASGALIERVARGDSLGRSVGFSWIPNPDALARVRTARFTVHRPRDRARELGQKIVARLPKGGAFMVIELRGPNPERTATTLNTTIQRFVDLAAELKASRLQEFAHTLDDQLRAAQQNLQQAEIALESFRVQTITQPTESPSAVPAGISTTTNPAFSGFVGLKLQEDQLKQDRAALGRALARAETAELSTTELDAIPAVQSASELKTALNELAGKRAGLRALLYKYTDEYIEVKKLRGEIRVLEEETVPTLVRHLMDELSRRQTQVGTLIASSSTELRQIPPRVMEEARLRRQVAIADNLYTMLRSRHEEARLAALGSSPDVRVIDRALPSHKPLKDQRNQMILLGFGGSLALVALGVLLLDKLDRRVRFPEEVTAGLRLPILAAIPRLKTNGTSNSENASQVIEAFRGLRLTMLQERGNQGCLVAAVTSPGSGDGKSFISVNLAFSLADQGYRTLLIDGDIRRGGLHHFLGCTRKPGLTDLLAGTATRESVVQSTSYPLLDLIACGRRLQGGPELLGSAALAQYIREFRSQYAVILIDTPPLGAGIDPFVLGMAAGNLALVLRTGLSDKEFTEAKLNVLDRLPVRILGAILNGVPPGGAYRYYGYIPGYESGDEENVAETPALPVLS